MLFGDPANFAVEAYHEIPKNFGASGLWGRMCIHIAGQMFGDISEQSCQLDHAILSLHSLSQRQEELWHEALDGKTDTEIFDFLDTALYKDVGRSREQMRSDWFHFGGFSFLTNWGEQFDYAPKAFIYSRHKLTRVVWRVHDGQVEGADIASSDFSEVAEVAHNWYSRETVPPL
ncbi:MAG: Imm42 family immunity protein [Prosthecobacter sp.]